MSTPVIILTVLYVLAIIVFHVYAVKKRLVATLISKTLASAFFIAIGAIGLATNPDISLAVYLFVGLCFGLVGDAILAARNFKPQYKYHCIGAGMVSFGIGHVFYLIALMANLPNAWISIAVGAAIGAVMVFMAPVLNLSYGRLKPFIFFYASLLSTMGAATALRCYHAPTCLNICLCAAGLLFMLSDALLSGIYFDKNQSKSTPFFIIGVHVTYYLAQYLIALSIAEF